MLIELLDQSALTSLSANTSLTIIDRSNMEKILAEHKLSLSGLVDTNKAIEVGNLLSAEYIITGNIIPMANSVIIFARVINVESSEVLAVSQVIIPKTEDIKQML